MNLLDIRKQVVGISGRYDLVVDSEDYADAGMDFYIQGGQKYLEHKLGITPAVAKLYKTLTAGDYIVQFKNCRSVREVWIMDNDVRTKLTKVTEEQMKSMFPRYADNAYMENPVFINTGRPLYYCPINLRRSPVEEDAPVDDAPSLSSYLDTVSPANPEYTGVLMMPATDKIYSVEIGGLFYDNTLVADTDSNFWSVKFPQLLIKAALRELAVFFAGSKTLDSWDKTIATDLLGIELDAVDQEIAEVTEMEG